MVKPPRKISHSDKSPQFFKIYVPDLCSQRLRIPPAFVKYFKGIFPSKSILESPAKRSWSVDANRIDDYLYFQKGWPEFVQDHSLVFGDFLIFCYTGNSKFYVSIFGKNNCQKELDITTRDSNRSLILLQGNQTVEPSKSKELLCLDSREKGTRMTLRSRVPWAIQEDFGALEASCKLVSKNPFFQIVMRHAYVSKGFLGIPLKFRKSYMDKPGPTARLQHSNKLWLVKMIDYGTRLHISRGWREFVKENTLQEGDVCSFELIERENYVFNVSILGGVDGGTPNKSLRHCTI